MYVITNINSKIIYIQLTLNILSIRAMKIQNKLKRIYILKINLSKCQNLETFWKSKSEFLYFEIFCYFYIIYEKVIINLEQIF